jgi:proteasome lid subunit RPN8/RPN11
LSTPFRLLLPRQVYDEMVAHAVAELPNECCGLLAGPLGPACGSDDEAPPVGCVVRRYPLVNVASSPVEYLSDPQSMFAAVRDMRRLGTDILAVYHSHPTSDPVPSRKDLERNYSPDIVNLIISLKSGEPVMRGWWLTQDGYEQAEWEWIG